LTMELAIMIEGQNGLNWTRWQRIAAAVEDLGFAGLYRSDHFTNASPPDLDSLELWVSLAWLASHTRRIQFGPLVTPFSSRHPVFTARMASAIDDLSQGRLTLGVGAGWQEREHTTFGFDLLQPAQRFDRFGEGLEIVTRLLQSDKPVSYSGNYYHLSDALLLPRPQRPGGPPILIGGNGVKRTLTYVVRYASEWNAVLIPPAEFSCLNKVLDGLLDQAGRPRAEVRRSLMTGIIFAKSDALLKQKLAGRKRSAAELRESGIVVGTPADALDQLRTFDAAGVQRIMLQWLDLDDLEGLQILAEEVLNKI